MRIVCAHLAFSCTALTAQTRLQNETRGESGGDNNAWGGARCSKLFDEAAADEGTAISPTSTGSQKQAYCEGALNKFIVEERLPDVLKFDATLKEKKSLKRVDDGATFGGFRTLPKGGTENGAVASGVPRALLAAVAAALALLAA